MKKLKRQNHSEIPKAAKSGLQPFRSSHVQDLHKLVRTIMCHCEQPENWPLSQQEQIAFIKTVMFRAREIRNSESYAATELALALRDAAS